MSAERIVGIVFLGIATILIFLGINYNGYFFLVGGCLLIPGFILFLSKGRIEKKEPAYLAMRIVNSLPESPTELTPKNIKKIHQLLPVPNDYKVLWAEVRAFGGHPAGVIITDQALIMKAERKTVSERNKEIKKENKGVKKKEKKPKINYIYRIIPWSYFTPTDYSFVEEGSGKKKVFHFVVDENTVFSFSCPELFKELDNIQREYSDIIRREELSSAIRVQAAINSVNVEPAIYMAKNGAANTFTGHGIIAEDLGTKLDKLAGMDATVVGRDNAKNGADKLVSINGEQIAIQCKYCMNATESVNHCFDDKTGLFRYYDLNGRPMRIEVPKDQYLQAIEEMKDKISQGLVTGVDDPEMASDIIREGRLTYDQVRNIAKAGTIQSLSYDFVTGAIRCSCVFGISFIISFAQVFWTTKDFKKATKCALITSAKVYGLSVIGSVLRSQLARAGLANLFYPMVKNILDRLPEKTIQSFASMQGGVVDPKMVAIDATRDYYARFLASQVAVQCVMFLVFSAPDINNYVSNNMSGGQFVMNMTERAAGMIGGGIAAGVAGSAVGKAAGTVAGGVVGFAAGAAGGVVSGLVVHTLSHLFREDDDVIIGRMFTAILINNIMDYMLDQDEQERLVEILSKENGKLKALRKALIASPNQSRDIQRYVDSIMKKVTRNRDKIRIDEKQMRSEMDEIVLKGELTYEM